MGPRAPSDPPRIYRNIILAMGSFVDKVFESQSSPVVGVDSSQGVGFSVAVEGQW